MSAVATVYSEMSHGLLVDEALKLREDRAALQGALQAITDHFAGVMGGPIMRAGGRFENGVEGIPTIAQARAVLRRVKGGIT